MLSVSDGFKAAAIAPERQAKTRLTVTFLENAMLAGFVSASPGESESIFAADHLVNGRSVVSKTWALARDDCYPADDLYPPDDNWETGWMSDETADGSAELSPAEEIIIEYTTAQRISDVRWWADEWLGYPVDFVLYYWDTAALAWVEIETVTGNAATSYSKTLDEIVLTTKLKMEISKISRANDHPALVELQGGMVVDLSEYVARWDATKERFYEQQGSLPLGNYGAGELNLELVNTDNRFAPANADGPYYGYLRLNRRLAVEVGFLVDDEYEYCDVGSYYVSSWVAASGSATARIVARDGAKKLQAQMYEGPVQEGALASDLIADLAASGGLDQTTLDIDDTDYAIPYAVFERKTIWDHMKALATGEGGCLYFDESGALMFENRDHLAAQTTVQATLDDANNIVQLNHEVDESRIRNAIQVTSKRLKEAAQATIWSLQESVTVPGSGQWWNANYYRRRQVTVTADSGVGNDISTAHTLKIRVEGDDAAAIYGVCQSDGGDLRVIYEDGGYTECDRYIDTWSSSLIVIYVRAQAAIAAGDSDSGYWLYYYNPAAGDAPDDGSVVFAIWDDFDRAVLGADWDKTHGDYVATMDGAHLVSTANVLEENCNYIWDHIQVAQSFEISGRVRMNGNYLGYHFVALYCAVAKSGDSYGGRIRYVYHAGEGYKWHPEIISAAAYELGDILEPSVYAIDQWHTLRLSRQGTNWTLYLNGAIVVELAGDATEPLYFGLGHTSDGASGNHAAYFDNFWVRFLPDVEPTVVVADPEDKPAVQIGDNTAQIEVRFQGPAVDVQAPVITAGGPDVSVLSYEYTSVGGTIVLQNTGPDETVTGMTIDGKLLESDGELVATAEDALSIAEFGEQGYELENDFIQDLTQAQEMADALLASYGDPARQIVIGMDARGQPHLQLADRVHVENEQTGVDADYWIVRSRLEFDGALSGELTCIEAS